MPCDTWFERAKLESNTTPRFLTYYAGETKDIDWEVWKELVMIVFEAYQDKFSVIRVQF